MDSTEIVAPIQGTIRYSKSDKSEYIRLDLADGSSIILHAGKDGFFDENFDQAKRYAVGMMRLLKFLEERAKHE